MADAKEPNIISREEERPAKEKVTKERRFGATTEGQFSDFPTTKTTTQPAFVTRTDVGFVGLPRTNK